MSLFLNENLNENEIRRFSLAEGERFGHRSSPSGSAVDPGSAPSRLRHSNLFCGSFKIGEFFQTATVVLTGGGGEIRTLDSLARIAVFKTAALGHYATPPFTRNIRIIQYEKP